MHMYLLKHDQADSAHRFQETKQAPTEKRHLFQSVFSVFC